MKKNAHLLIVLLITLLVCKSLFAKSLVGQAAPDWTLSNIADETVQFPKDYLGAPTVVLFWATWCPYCAALMPYLEEIRIEYAESGVKILALNFKEDGDPVTHMRRLGFDFEVFLEADKVAQSYGARYSPGLYVVDGRGRVIYQRKSTDKSPGQEIAKFWAEKVREALNTE